MTDNSQFNQSIHWYDFKDLEQVRNYTIDRLYAKFFGFPEEQKKAEVKLENLCFAKFPSYEYTAPAKKFEQKVNLKGISGEYIFPNNMSAQDWELHCRKEIDANYEFVWIKDLFTNSEQTQKKLKKLNPERLKKLAQLKPIEQKQKTKEQIFYHKFFTSFIKNNPEICKLPITKENKRDVFFGVTSLFNPDDIYYYITVPTEKRKPQILKRQEKIEKFCKTNLGWIASPKTLNKIEKQLKISTKIENLISYRQPR